MLPRLVRLTSELKRKKTVFLVIIIVFIPCLALGQATYEDIPRLVEELHSENPQIRYNASYQLACIGTPGIDALIQVALEDPDSTAREGAVHGLYSRAVKYLKTPIDSAIVTVLITALTDSCAGVRVEAASNFKRRATRSHWGASPEYSAVEPLIDVLLHDVYWGARSEAAEALGAIRDERAVMPLIEAMTNDQDEGVRSRAAFALGCIPDDCSVDALINTMLNDEYDYARREAAESLGRIRDSRATGALIVALNDDDGMVRSAAAEALGRLRDPGAVDALIMSVLEDDYYMVVERAAQALGKIGDSRAIAPLCKVVVDFERTFRFSEARCAVAKQLGKFGDPAAVEPLAQALVEEEPNKKGCYARALVRIGIPAVPALIKLLKPQDYEYHSFTRREAAYALGDIGDTMAVGPLIAALDDEDYEVVNRAAEALGKIRDPRAIGPIVGALESDRWLMNRTKWYLIRALAEIGEPSVIPLLDLLSDEDYFIRGEAADALGDIGDTRAVEPLIEALKDPTDFVKGHVFLALTRICEPADAQELGWDYDAWRAWWEDNKEDFLRNR